MGCFRSVKWLLMKGKLRSHETISSVSPIKLRAKRPSSEPPMVFIISSKKKLLPKRPALIKPQSRFVSKYRAPALRKSPQ